MSHTPLKHFVHHLSHQASRERAKGNAEGANGMALIGLGIVLMPIPVIGLPLLVWGIVKLCKSPPSKSD